MPNDNDKMDTGGTHAMNQEVLKQAAEMAIPRIYFNGFITAISQADVRITLTLNGNEPVADLNCSYTVAKTLAQKLGIAIRTLENKTGKSMLTTEDVLKALQSSGESE